MILILQGNIFFIILLKSNEYTNAPNNSKIIIITGGLGFLGRQFVEELAKKKFYPIILDKKNRIDIQKFLNRIKY